MRWIEKIKLIYRAYRYQHKNDIGGIKYVQLSIVKGDTVMDIGAHKGGYLYFIMKLTGSNGKIFAFEPQSALYNYLIKLKKIMQWNSLSIHHLALSDHNAAATLYIPISKKTGTSPGATLIHSADKINFKEEQIETDTLDNFCRAQNIKPNLLKIDVEGNELKVLEGARDTLRNYKPKIIFECEERHVGSEQVLKTFRFLESFGYTGKFICNDEFISLSEFDFKKHQSTSSTFYCNNFIFE